MHFLTHFGRFREDAIVKPRACVAVRVTRQRGPCTLRIEDAPLRILKADALMAPLPEDVVVLHVDGRVCKATGRFYVTTESFDPCHMLTDVF